MYIVILISNVLFYNLLSLLSSAYMENDECLTFEV